MTPQEVVGRGGTPTLGRQLHAIKRFSEAVVARMAYDSETAVTQSASYNTVGLLLPDATDGIHGYSPEVVGALTGLIENTGYTCRILPHVADSRFATALHQLDWVVVDVGSGHSLLPMAAFLHGQFTPLLLLKWAISGEASSPSDLERSLFGGFEVGYSEDVLIWNEPKALFAGVEERLATIDAMVERLNTIDEAREYFTSAGRRKERVFLSYAGEDLVRIAGLREELRRRFQDVFDYKTVGSISPGSNWVQDLFATLSSSAIGIIFLSEHYLASGTCQHEAAELVARGDQKKTALFVVNLDGTSPPEHLRYLQYVAPEQFVGDAALVDSIVAEVTAGSAGPVATPPT